MKTLRLLAFIEMKKLITVVLLSLVPLEQTFAMPWPDTKFYFVATGCRNINKDYSFAIACNEKNACIQQALRFAKFHSKDDNCSTIDIHGIYDRNDPKQVNACRWVVQVYAGTLYMSSHDMK